MRGWRLTYLYHISVVETSATRIDFQVVFSRPTPRLPIPRRAIYCPFRVEAPHERDAGPRILYSLEGEQLQRLAEKEPMRDSMLDRVDQLKARMERTVASYEWSGKIAEPRAFVKGEHIARAKVELYASIDLADAAERVAESAMKADMAIEEHADMEMESTEKLEARLHQIFTEADANGDGRLSIDELRLLMTTADLPQISNADVRNLLARADINNDGFLEYEEFIPLACEVIGAMRSRKLHERLQRQHADTAEVCARMTLHGLTPGALTEQLIEAFKSYDANGDGTLSREEFGVCLREIELGSTKLTELEVRHAMACVDLNDDGVIEYAEFAPVMFDALVDALALGFMPQDYPQLVAYLLQVFREFDEFAAADATAEAFFGVGADGADADADAELDADEFCMVDRTGRLSREQLTQALLAADLIRLTPLQALTVASVATDDGGGVDYALFATEAAPLIGEMTAPAVEARRAQARHDVVSLVEGRKAKALREATIKSFRRMFAQYDPDGSGVLDRAAFRHALEESKLGLTRRQILFLYIAADADEDGRIDVDQFIVAAYDSLVELAREEKAEEIVRRNSVDDAGRDRRRRNRISTAIRSAADATTARQAARATAAPIPAIDESPESAAVPSWDASEEFSQFIAEVDDADAPAAADGRADLVLLCALVEDLMEEQGATAGVTGAAIIDAIRTREPELLKNDTVRVLVGRLSALECAGRRFDWAEVYEMTRATRASATRAAKSMRTYRATPELDVHDLQEQSYAWM